MASHLYENTVFYFYFFYKGYCCFVFPCFSTEEWILVLKEKL